MSVRAWTWLVVLLSFAGYLVVLLWVRSRSTGAFYRPVRRVRALPSGIAAAAAWISAASYLSLAAVAARSPRDGAVYVLGWVAGFAVLALAVAPYLARAGRHTLPQLVAERFGSPAAGAVAVACSLLVTFTYLAAQLRGTALVLARFVPLPLPWAVAAAAAGILGYTALGRLRTLTGGQVAQYVVLTAAYFVVAGAALRALGRGAAPQLAPMLPLDASGLGGLGDVAAGSGAPERPPLDSLATALALVAGTAALPHMVARFLAMPRPRDARASAGWGLAFVVLFYGAVPAAALAIRAAGPGLRGVDPDVRLLAAPEVLGVAPWVVAVGAAGALAAAVSAAAGHVLALGAGVARDLLKGNLLPGLSDAGERRVARLAAAALTFGAAGLALRPPGSILQTVGLGFGLAAAAFFPALTAAAFWRRATRDGVLWGMIAGAGFTIGYVHWFRFARPELDGPAHWWLGISPDGIGAVGALLGAAVLVAVSLLAPGPRAAPR